MDFTDFDCRMIALDLDGTLLDSQKRLSAANRDALAAAAAGGIEIVPTTGRFFGMMPECVRELPFVRYAITINGAQVFDCARGEALVKNEIPLATALGVMELLDRHDVIYDCYRNNWGWMSEPFKAKAAFYATDAHYLSMIREFRRGVPELKAHLRATPADGDAQKIMLFSRLDAPRGSLEPLADEIEKSFPDLKVTSSTWNNLEINAKTAHKGAALDRFARALGFTPANCMAFGDGANDLTMIEAAGMGVAMANSCPAVLAAADAVTLSNDADGVAAAIREYLAARREKESGC